MAMKTHTYYIIFGRPPIGGKLPLATHSNNSPTFKNYGTFLWNLVPRDAVPVKRIDESSWFFVM